MSTRKCGLCVIIAELLRKAMCMGSRRNSTESCYKEAEDEETMNAGEEQPTTTEVVQINQPAAAIDQADADAESFQYSHEEDRYSTLQISHRKRMLRHNLIKDIGLLDDLQPAVLQSLLEHSDKWTFNVFTLEAVSSGNGLAELCIHLFKVYNLFTHFNIDMTKARKLFSLIEHGYHTHNPYHNSMHAVDVTQAMHCFLQQEQILMHITPIEILACLIAAIAHDIDHPGMNQPYLVATSNHLAIMYKNMSVLENHHWRSAISCIINSKMLEHMKVYHEELVDHISSLILATDISRQEEYLSQFKVHLDTSTLDLSRREHRRLVLQIALKCADISNPCREWKISEMWSEKVCEEFFIQGDIEREINLPISPLCDRHNNTVAKIQTGFFKFVVCPLVCEWDRFLQSELTKEMLENLGINQARWEAKAALEPVVVEAENVSAGTSSSPNTSGESSQSLPQPNPDQDSNDIKEPVIATEQAATEHSELMGGRSEDSSERSETNSEQYDEHSQLLGERSEMFGERSDLFSEPSELFSDLSTRSVDASGEIFELIERPFATSEMALASTAATSLPSSDRDYQLYRVKTFPPFYTDNRLDEGQLITKTQKVSDIHNTNAESFYGVPKIASSDSSPELDTESASVFISHQSEKSRDSEPTNKSIIPSASQPLLRRESDSSTKDKIAAAEKKMREVTVALPELLRRHLAGDCWARRRGSAPVTPVTTVNDNESNSDQNGITQWLSKMTIKALSLRRNSLPSEMIHAPVSTPE